MEGIEEHLLCRNCYIREKQWGSRYCSACLHRRFYVEDNVNVNHIKISEKKSPIYYKDKIPDTLDEIKEIYPSVFYEYYKGKGPFTLDEIKDAINTGEINKNTLIYSIPDFLDFELYYLSDQQLRKRAKNKQDLSEDLLIQSLNKGELMNKIIKDENFPKPWEDDYPQPWVKTKDLLNLHDRRGLYVQKYFFYSDFALAENYMRDLKKLNVMKGFYDMNPPGGFDEEKKERKHNPLSYIKEEELLEHILNLSSTIPKRELENKRTLENINSSPNKKQRNEIPPVDTVEDIIDTIEQDNSCSGNMCNIMGGNKKKSRRKSKRKSKKRKSKKKSKRKTKKK